MPISAAYLAYYRAQLGANVKLPLSNVAKTVTATLVGAGLEDIVGRLETLGYTVTLLETSSADTALPDLLIDLTGSRLLRRALEAGGAFYTTLEAAQWLVTALEKLGGTAIGVSSLQEWQSTVV